MIVKMNGCSACLIIGFKFNHKNTLFALIYPICSASEQLTNLSVRKIRLKSIRPSPVRRLKLCIRIKYFCFNNKDITPEGGSLKKFWNNIGLIVIHNFNFNIFCMPLCAKNTSYNIYYAEGICRLDVFTDSIHTMEFYICFVNFAV